MGPSLTKENNTDPVLADQHSHLVTGDDWRKTSCPSNIPCTTSDERYHEQDTHSYPDTPPPSPITLQYILGQTLSHSSTSSNPSPVPSLEYIFPNELFTNIPDTCPNIKALINSHEVLVAPKDRDIPGNSSLKPSPKPPNNASYPFTVHPLPDLSSLKHRENNSGSRSPSSMNNYPSSFAPVKSLGSPTRGQQQPTQNNSNVSQLIQE